MKGLVFAKQKDFDKKEDRYIYVGYEKGNVWGGGFAQ